MEFHDNVLAGDNLTAEEFTFVAIERAYFSAVEFDCVAVGPVDRPQARLRIEQSHGEAFEWLAVKLRMKNVEVSQAQQYRVAFLGRVKFIPSVAAGQLFFQRTISDVPVTHQIIEIIPGRGLARCYRKVAV